MKKRKVLLSITALGFIVFLSAVNVVLNLNDKSNSLNVSLMQQARAEYHCAEYYYGMMVCCFSGGGGCNSYGVQMDGPYYNF